MVIGDLQHIALGTRAEFPRFAHMPVLIFFGEQSQTNLRGFSVQKMRDPFSVLSFCGLSFVKR